MYYIAVNKENNKMLGSYNFKPSNFNYNKLYLIEAESLPKKNSNQYLVAENITTNIRVIKEAYIDEETNIEHPQETEEYLTCTFKAVELPIRELTEEEKHERYKAEVKRLIRLKYSPDDVEAMLCNNSKASIKEEHRIEFEIFQAYRDECKAKAHKEVYGK